MNYVSDVMANALKQAVVEETVNCLQVKNTGRNEVDSRCIHQLLGGRAEENLSSFN